MAQPSRDCATSRAARTDSRMAPSGRRNRATNGGGPHISFGHHANLNPSCVRRLLRIAHYLKCGASGNDQWRLVRPDCRRSSKKTKRPKNSFELGRLLNSPPPKSAQKYHANNANRPSVQNCTISKYVHRSRPTRPLSQNLNCAQNPLMK